MKQTTVHKVYIRPQERVTSNDFLRRTPSFKKNNNNSRVSVFSKGGRNTSWLSTFVGNVHRLCSLQASSEN